MSVIKLDLGDLSKELKANGRAQAAAVKGGIMNGARRGRAHMVRLSHEAVDAYMGQFAASWYVEDTGEGVRLGNDAPHAGIIERGARPHPVSEEGQFALKRWIEVKLKDRVRSVAKQRRAYGGGGDFFKMTVTKRQAIAGPMLADPVEGPLLPGQKRKYRSHRRQRIAVEYAMKKVKGTQQQHEDRYVNELLQAILWKIRTQGQEGTFITEKALPDLRDMAKQEVDRRFKQLAERSAKKFAKQPGGGE